MRRTARSRGPRTRSGPRWSPCTRSRADSRDLGLGALEPVGGDVLGQHRARDVEAAPSALQLDARRREDFAVPHCGRINASTFEEPRRTSGAGCGRPSEQSPRDSGLRPPGSCMQLGRNESDSPGSAAAAALEEDEEAHEGQRVPRSDAWAQHGLGRRLKCGSRATSAEIVPPSQSQRAPISASAPASGRPRSARSYCR